jgi:hypothetical protein
VNDKIKHKPYDLGLGIDLGCGSSIQVSDYCLTEHVAGDVNLFWELKGAEKPVLLIKFFDVEVLRVLDEMWLSTETHPQRWEGIDGSFARTVVGGEYPTGSDILKDVSPEAKHYQFVTNSDCVDVIARTAPKALLLDLDRVERHRLVFPIGD